jgi:hypothetical protein
MLGLSVLEGGDSRAMVAEDVPLTCAEKHDHTRNIPLASLERPVA